MRLKFDIGDDIVIIDHTTKEFIWCKGQIVDMVDDDNIFVYLDRLKVRTKVNDRQLMQLDTAQEFLRMCGADDEDFREWALSELWEGDYGSRDLPPVIEEKEVCTCEMTELMRYGCRCEVGCKQLKEEKDAD
jgi:hypothetical protein